MYLDYRSSSPRYADNYRQNSPYRRETEQEARRILARDHVCFFAGRIRTGGAHA
ncbi:host cell division inhibitor Icd-like protein [Escherichia coli]|nr:host cell division inhibitor Icd-like protein [Escherichia coli]